LAFAMGNGRFVRFGYAFVCGIGLADFVGFALLSNEDIIISHQCTHLKSPQEDLKLDREAWKLHVHFTMVLGVPA